MYCLFFFPLTFSAIIGDWNWLHVGSPSSSASITLGITYQFTLVRRTILADASQAAPISLKIIPAPLLAYGRSWIVMPERGTRTRRRQQRGASSPYPAQCSSRALYSRPPGKKGRGLAASRDRHFATQAWLQRAAEHGSVLLATASWRLSGSCTPLPAVRAR